MKVFNTSFTLQTEGGTEVSDITKHVRDALHRSSVTTGIALVNTLHTTCALFINEYQSALIDDITARFTQPKDFVVPGENRLSAALDVARTMVRRAERDSLEVAHADSVALAYLNRLSDLLWTLARWQESETVLAKTGAPAPR